MKYPTLLLLVVFSFLFACNLSNEETATNPVIAGSATLSGQIHTPRPEGREKIQIRIVVAHPILAEIRQYILKTDSSGNFTFTFDTELENTLVYVTNDFTEEPALSISAKSNDTTHLQLYYEANGRLKSLRMIPEMNAYDVRQATAKSTTMITHRSGEDIENRKFFHDKSPESYLKHVAERIAERTAFHLGSETGFSEGMKDLLARDYKLAIYSTYVFDYEKQMNLHYAAAHPDATGTPKLQNIDNTYFGFLKDLGLNDSKYLQTISFPEFQQALLADPALNLPEMGEQDVQTWIEAVKEKLGEALGFDEGWYYDVLAANSYALQLTRNVRPLSSAQIRHIESYWGDGEIAKILLRTHQEVARASEAKAPLVINDVSHLTPAEVMRNILRKHSDKVVFIDLWATWCGPCLSAMKEFSPAKAEFKDKDVVFVYLTNGSSPKELWNAHIEGLGSEHYYLSDAQWDYILEEFDLEGIPSYLLYNKSGQLVEQFTGFPGNDTVRRLLKTHLR